MYIVHTLHLNRAKHLTTHTDFHLRWSSPADTSNQGLKHQQTHLIFSLHFVQWEKSQVHPTYLALETMTRCQFAHCTLIRTWPAWGEAKNITETRKWICPRTNLWCTPKVGLPLKTVTQIWCCWHFALISMTAFSRSVTRGQTSSYQLSPFPQHATSSESSWYHITYFEIL